MKILFICHKIPYPPDKGEKIRAFHMLRRISAKHEVALFALYDDKKDNRYADSMGSLCKETHLYYLSPIVSLLGGAASLFAGKPASLGYFYSAMMRKDIKKFISKSTPDLIMVSSSSMAQYAMDTYKARTTIIDMMDCDSAKWKQYGEFHRGLLRFVYRKEAKFLRRYEKAIAGRFDSVLVSTESERSGFSEFMDTGNFVVLTNGVDREYFKPIAAEKKKKIVFCGTMDYFVNTDGVEYFCGEILPRIRRSVPDVEFHIIGRDPTDRVKRLTTYSGVYVTGYVKDTRENMKDAALFVAPLRISQGVQNKILCAMAMGLPVVATARAVKGLSAAPGRDLLVADTPEDFADKTVMLLKDALMREKISENAVRYIKNKHDWEDTLRLLDRLIERPEEAPGINGNSGVCA